MIYTYHSKGLNRQPETKIKGIKQSKTKFFWISSLLFWCFGTGDAVGQAPNSFELFFPQIMIKKKHSTFAIGLDRQTSNLVTQNTSRNTKLGS